MRPIVSSSQSLPRPLSLRLPTEQGRAAMAHYFEIKQNKAGEFVAYFKYNSETMFWTEGYKSRASAVNAIESIKKNGPGADTKDAG
jgi:uncharacterized protein